MTSHDIHIAPTLSDEKRNAALLWIVISIAAMDVALQIDWGFYNPAAIQWMGIALAANLVALARPRMRLLDGWTSRNVAAIVSLCLLLHLLLLMIFIPATFLHLKNMAELRPFRIFMGICAIAVMAGMVVPARFIKWQMLIMLGAFALAGAWVIRHAPDPYMDTYTMQQQSCDLLVHGKNPYDATYPNIYGDDTPYYPKELIVNGQVQAGYSYPPLTLLMALPAYAIAGDHRYAQLAGLIVSAVLLACSTSGGNRLGLYAAMLMLTTPRIFQVIESSWTEPLVLVPLAATVFCAARYPRAVPWMFGLFLVSKQSHIVFAPAGLWLIPAPRSLKTIAIFFAKAAAIAIVITLPFVLWNPAAFYRSVIAAHLAIAPRMDSLSLPTFLSLNHLPSLPRFVSILVIPVIYLIGWLRLPRTPAGFGYVLASAAFVLFFFDQAFLNRHFFILATMCIAVSGFVPKPSSAR